jgi:Bacterial CdiA-CT RNAse A domain
LPQTFNLAANRGRLRQKFNRASGRGGLRPQFNRASLGRQTLRRKFNDVARAGRPLPPPSSSPLLVPGGGLLAHEKKPHEKSGGHTLREHIGKTEGELRGRLNTDKKIPAASSFYDHATAESAVARVLARNSKDLSGWLAGGGVGHVITGDAGKPVGLSILRGQRNVTHVTGVRIYVVRDPGMTTGYRIISAYPQ